MLTPYPHLQSSASFPNLSSGPEHSLNKDQAKALREILTLVVHGKSNPAHLAEKLKGYNIQNAELISAIQALEEGAENAIPSLIGSISTQFNIFIAL